MPNNPRGLELNPENLARLRTLIRSDFSEWSVCLAQVDLDGIGSAYGTAEIIRGEGMRAFPYYAGKFDDPQNIRVRDALDLGQDFRPIAALPAAGPIALVDSCKLVDLRFDDAIDPHRVKIITDHHVPDEDIEDELRFVHISFCGAASTLVWEQAKAFGTALSRRTCTLIALGIHSDTNKLKSPATTDADCRAFYEARSQADTRVMEACFHYPLPKRYYALAAKTYRGWRQIGPVVISHPTRRMHTEESGYISRWADRFLQLEGPQIVLVWCLTETHVRFSFRTEDMGYDLSALIDQVCGHGRGGAKHGSGGARVPLAALPVAPSDYDDEMIGKIDAHVRERVAAYFKAAP